MERLNGLEPSTFSLGSRKPTSQPVENTGVYGGDTSTPSDSPSSCTAIGPSDPELARVATAWPHLPDHVRATILSLLGTAESPPAEVSPSPPTKDDD